jgi:hypothetical protein
MKTLRLLRNVAALFVLCYSMFISPSAVSAYPGCKWMCINTENRTHCKLQSNGGCVTEQCNGKCKGTACLYFCYF